MLFAGDQFLRNVITERIVVDDTPGASIYLWRKTLGLFACMYAYLIVAKSAK